jgi:metallo-beta-lactamase family protein
MKITFLGAVGTVTGSKYLLSFDDKKILVDCGLYQGLKELRLRNWSKLPVDPKTIDAVILTHAHIDHSGYLPLLIKQGFKGKIYCSAGTRDLCEVLLPDSGYLQEEEAELANKFGYSKHKPALPLYTRQDGIDAIKLFHVVSFEKKIQLSSAVSFELLSSGHIIGSSFVKIYYDHSTLLFSGDLGRPNDPVMKPPVNIKEIDYLVLESTYGNRAHETGHPKDYLKDIINKTISRGGSVIIPAFAVGRAQALLYYVYLLKKEKAIPDVPVYLDSPMAIDSTHILLEHRDYIRLSEEECRALNKVAIFVNTAAESQNLSLNKTPKIIISASGMATGGRVLFHIQAYAPDEKNTILFTGYQAMGTRGDRMLRGEKEVKMHGEMTPIKAEVALLSNTSAHADYKEILSWLSHFTKAPKKVFITHGEENAANALKEKIQDRFHWQCVVPHYQQSEKL